MEMNSDLIAIQGLLTSVVKTTGEFSKIKYKGGNEMKINLVIKELEEYLVSKQYLEKRKSNKKYQTELENIALFLTINSEFKCTAAVLQEIKEFSHLINIVPVISKCLLANVIVELDLCEYYSVSLHKIPLELCEELLVEFIPCIKSIGPKQSIECSYTMLTNIIKKISSVDSSVAKAEEMIEKLEDITSEILLNVSGINPEQLQGLNKLRIYKLIGYSLLNLLKLLRVCDVENCRLCKTIGFLLSTLSNVIQAVTIKVFCGWAEVHYREEVLQTAISSEAYFVVEKYQKYEPAHRLIQMLGSFAKKPKTINEMIQESDIATIISKINKSDCNQKLWFKALLNCWQIFDNVEAINCLKTWSKLCTLGDVTRLLNLSVTHKNVDMRKLIVMCASHLNEPDLKLAVMRFFNQHGLKSCLDSGDVASRLTTALNKLEPGSGDEFKKELLLLVLQNPEVVVMQLHRECIKSRVLLTYLSDVFEDLMNVLQIEGLSTRALEIVMADVKPDFENVGNYERLCQILIATTFSGNKVINRMVKNYTEFCYNEERYDDLKYAFQLYQVVTDKSCIEQHSSLFLMAINILEKCRWKFFSFTNIKADLCEKCVNVCSEYLERQFPLGEEVESVAVEHYLNKYYVLRLHKSVEDFPAYVCPDYNNHSKTLCTLIKLIPICVSTELRCTTEYLHCRCGTDKFLEVFTDAILLISQVAKTQNTDTAAATCLRYCVQNYGMIIKDLILPLNNCKANVSVARYVCRLLREIPEEIVRVEGMSLLSLLSRESLQSLVALEDGNVLQVIAKNMLS